MALYTVQNRTDGVVIPPPPFSRTLQPSQSVLVSAPVSEAENVAVQRAINAGLISVTSANDPNFDDPIEGGAADASGLGAGTVGSSALADLSVTTVKLAATSVTAAKLAAEAVYATNVGPQDADGNASLIVHTQDVAAGGGGSPDDVAVTLSADNIIVDVQFLCTTAVGASTVTLRDTAGGAGTALSSALDTATTGRKQDDGTLGTPNLSSTAAFLRRVDDGVGGVLVIYYRKNT